MKISDVPNLAMNWQDVLLERKLLLGKNCRPDAPLSYPLDHARLAGARIEWPSQHGYLEAERWIDHIKLGLSALVPVEVVPVDVGQKVNDPLPVTFRLVVGGRSYPVTIDFSDYMDLVFDEPLESSLLYFKWQYRRQGYEDRTAHHAKMLPGGYVGGSIWLYKFLPHIRAAEAQRTYATDVFGRFGLTFAREIRQKATRLLSEQTHFRYTGGLNIKNRYIGFLRECQESKICVDLPSNSDFCCRLVDYMAVGCCIVAPQHRVTFPVDLEDGKNVVYVERDLSDLVEKCRYYLEHEDERQAIAREARSYFDRYLHCEQVAAYYLHECLRRIDA